MRSDGRSDAIERAMGGAIGGVDSMLFAAIRSAHSDGRVENWLGLVRVIGGGDRGGANCARCANVESNSVVVNFVVSFVEILCNFWVNVVCDVS